MKNKTLFKAFICTITMQMSVALHGMYGYNFEANSIPPHNQIAEDEAFARALAQEEGMEGYRADSAVVVIEPSQSVVPQAEVDEFVEMVMPFAVYVAGKQDNATLQSEVAVKSSFDGVARQLESIIDGKRIAEKPTNGEVVRLSIMHLIDQAFKAYKDSYDTTLRTYKIILPKHSINSANLLTDETQLKLIQKFVNAAFSTSVLKTIAPLQLNVWTVYTTGKDAVLYLEQSKINQLNRYASFVESVGIALFSPMESAERKKIISYQSEAIKNSQLPVAIKAHAQNIVAVAMQD